MFSSVLLKNEIFTNEWNVQTICLTPSCAFEHTKHPNCSCMCGTHCVRVYVMRACMCDACPSACMHSCMHACIHAWVYVSMHVLLVFIKFTQLPTLVNNHLNIKNIKCVIRQCHLGRSGFLNIFTQVCVLNDPHSGRVASHVLVLYASSILYQLTMLLNTNVRNNDAEALMKINTQAFTLAIASLSVKWVIRPHLSALSYHPGH